MKYFTDLKRYFSENGKEIFVIYGAGNIGLECFDFLLNNDIDIAFFVDSDSNQSFRQENGKTVFSPDIFGRMPTEKVFVFVAVSNNDKYSQITQTLVEHGFTSKDFCHASNKFIQKTGRFQVNTEKAISYAQQYKTNQMPLFRQVEIEMINRCNGKCGFCPVNAKSDTRPYAKMSDELFFSIIAQLKELNYTGRISLHSNSEPLLDERLIPFARHVHEELPNAYFILLTNGTLLTTPKFKELVDCLDFLLINNYSNDYEFHTPVKQVYEYCMKHHDIAKKVRIHKRLDNEVLATRGGESPNAGPCEVFGHVCAYPFVQMIIRPDGKCSLCCNDALGQMTLGDLNKQSVLEVWNGEEYSNVRKLVLRGSEYIPLCHSCDNSPAMIANPNPENKLKNNGALVRIGR